MTLSVLSELPAVLSELSEAWFVAKLTTPCVCTLAPELTPTGASVPGACSVPGAIAADTWCDGLSSDCADSCCCCCCCVCGKRCCPA